MDQDNVPVGRGRHRSPNYPAVSLPEAIDRVSRLYAADKKAGSPVDAAYRHMGFSGKNGKSAVVMSALKKYGLVDEANGRIAPTQRAVEILVLGKDDSRRAAAIRDAALAPEIHRELVEQYSVNGLPSPESLASELIAFRGFNPAVVKAFVADFLATLDFAGLVPSSELSLEVQDDMAMRDQPTRTIGGILTQPPAASSTTFANVAPANFRSFSFPLSNEHVAELRVPAGLKKEQLDLLREFINFTIRALSGTGQDSPAESKDSRVEQGVADD